MNIALVGLPGAGKSVIGRRLGQHWSIPFVDSDRVIEERMGCSIREYFDREGEAGFREIEKQVIAELAASAHGIVATGGGAILREANRRNLREHFHVIYLRSSPEELMKRLRHDVKRPLLQVADPIARLRALYQVRDPLYREVAHTIVDTGRPSIAALIDTIVTRLGSSDILGRSSESESSPDTP